MKSALLSLADEVLPLAGRLVLSDLFRSYEEQNQAHKDFVSGKKDAYSPPPGRSFHESGRAFDLDLKALGSLGATGDRLTVFHKLAARHGVTPITAPDIKQKEAWHFELRGSHQTVYDYYAAGKGTNMKPASAAAASAIVSAGLRVDFLGDTPVPGYVQSGLIRLGQDIGNLDGQIGPGTRKALRNLGISAQEPEDMAQAVEALLMVNFPKEYFVAQVDGEES
ncbi:M15 family metallopeptidase [Fundidesulfovibrio magnetotacticus]|nr:M15 family metallopeptidase [Fundidesulfovibrio magnetotacticus]